MSYVIRLASFNEINTMLNWATQEKWNPGLKDAFSFQLIDPRGFFIAYLDNKPISCISILKYADNYSFLGLYIVKPDYRGQGYGYHIWQHAMQYASLANIGLDGVVEQQANYAKSGFHLAHRNIRYKIGNLYCKDFSHANLWEVKTLPMALLLDYDAHIFPCRREAFLMQWLLAENARAFAYYDNNKDKTIKGYGVIRQCHEGYKIGPLFSDTSEIAETILQKLCSTANVQSAIYLDLPENNRHVKTWINTFKLTPVFETARMYTQNIPLEPIDKIFGITTFEVG